MTNRKSLQMKHRWWFCSAAILLSFVGCASTPSTIQGQAGQHPHSFTRQITTTARVNYLLFLPQDYEKTKEMWPLILFLHGSGECGEDLELVKRHGPPMIVEKQMDFPFIVLSPQCPQGEGWSSESLSSLLDEITRQYRVDKDRVYLTGLSMGGYASWSLAMMFPGKFSAIAPICGGGDANAVCAIRDLPVWVFHGAKDNIVPIENSEEMVTALRACGGNVKFTVYPEAGHNSWTAAYNDHQLYEWFLSHRRSTNTKNPER